MREKCVDIRVVVYHPRKEGLLREKGVDISVVVVYHPRKDGL